jgi:hypothetical protein
LIRISGKDSLPGFAPMGFDYRIAGHDLWADVPLPLLSGYGLGPARYTHPPEPMAHIGACAAPARSASGWLAGDTRRVICRSGSSGREIDIAGLARFVLSSSGDRIFCAGRDAGVAPALVEEALLGPPITLALALQGVWCLHASAVLRQGRAILFLGASGQGKSTLAAHCALTPEAGYRRIGDDILPCALVGSTPCARPGFPQLKLTPADRYPPDADEDVPIGAIFVLHAIRETGDIRLESMAVGEAVKALADQTVAVGLLDRSLAAAHLRFIARLVQSVPMHRLHYPHDYARLPHVFQHLQTAALGGLCRG